MEINVLQSLDRAKTNMMSKFFGEAAEGVTPVLFGNDLFSYNTKSDYNHRLAEESAVVGALTRWAADLAIKCPRRVLNQRDEEVAHPLPAMYTPRLIRQTIRSMFNSGHCVYKLDGDTLQYIRYRRIGRRKDNLTINNKILGPEYSRLVYRFKDDSDIVAASPFVEGALQLKLDRALAEGIYGRWKNPLVGIVLTPDVPKEETWTKADQENLQKQLDAAMGQKQGNTMTFNGRLKVTELQGLAKKLSIVEAQNYVELRLCSLVGISPATVQLNSGYQNQVGATVVEENRQSYLNGGFPLLDLLGEEITKNVLYHYWAGTTNGLRFEFDYSGIDYETATNRAAETDRILSIYESELPIAVEWFLNELGIPLDQLRTDNAGE